MPNTPAYPVVVAELAAKLPAVVALQPEERDYFASSIPAEKAIEAGAQIESVSVLDEVLRIGALVIPHVAANKVVGYGPLRARYLLDLTTELAAHVATLDSSRVEAAGAGAAKTTSLRGTRGLRRDAIRVLKNLAGGRPEDEERLRRARRGKEKPDERARSLEALANELEAAIAKVPQKVALDAGATPALVAALRQSASAVLATRGEAQGARGAVASIYDVMNLLDGRIVHELRLLVGAVNDARKEDKSVPAVRCPLLRNGNRKTKTAAKPPAQGGNSAPVNG